MTNSRFRLWVALCTLVSLAVVGVLIWAVIKVVTWLTAQ